MSDKQASEGITRICSHRIRWWYEDSKNLPIITELPECEENHIKKLLCQNFVSGELCHCDANDNTYYGWWEINR